MKTKMLVIKKLLYLPTCKWIFREMLEVFQIGYQLVNFYLICLKYIKNIYLLNKKKIIIEKKK